METSFRVLFDSLPGLYAVLSPQFKFVSMTHAYSTAINRKPEELVGKSFIDFLKHESGSDGHKVQQESLERAVELKRPHTIENLRQDVVGTDGKTYEERYWRILNVPILDHDQVVTHIIHQAEDVTDSVFLERTEEEYGRFFSISLDMLCISSGDGYFKKLSPSFADTLGWSIDELLSIPYAELVHPDDLAATMKEVERQVVLGEKVFKFENRYRHKDGTWRTLSWRSVPQPGGLMFATARDVTEIRHAQAQIASLLQIEAERASALEAAMKEVVRANQAKSDFVSNMSHELRTPLNAIIGFGEFLHDGKAGELNPQQVESIEIILSSGRHLLRLIKDILDLAKIESGKFELELGQFSLERSIAESCSVIRALANQKRVNVALHIAEDREVHLDEQKFKQILFNLLSNAVKFSEDGTEVTIEVQPCPNDFFELRIRDQGIGISESDIPNLFREFSQLESGSSKRYEGTGLGLALTRRFVELHGGTIRVESQIGSGSCFIVTMPNRAQPPGIDILGFARPEKTG